MFIHGIFVSSCKCRGKQTKSIVSHIFISCLFLVCLPKLEKLKHFWQILHWTLRLSLRLLLIFSSLFSSLSIFKVKSSYKTQSCLILGIQNFVMTKCNKVTLADRPGCAQSFFCQVVCSTKLSHLPLLIPPELLAIANQRLEPLKSSSLKFKFKFKVQVQS